MQKYRCKEQVSKIVHSSWFIVRSQYTRRRTTNDEPRTNLQNLTPYSLSPTPRLGFTLIELLVVITIISILAAIGISTFTPNQIRGRDSQRKFDLKNLQTALESYHNDQTMMSYPAGNTYSALTSALQSPTKYLKTVPADPSSGGTYFYTAYKDSSGNTTCDNASSATSCQEYVLCAKLENTNDPDITKSPCTYPNGSSVPNYNYGVKSP